MAPRITMSAYPCSSLVLMVRLAVVANDFHSPDHGAHSKKAQDFSAYDTDGCYLLPVDIADTAEYRLWSREARAGKERSRVAGGVGKWLEVGLELGDRAAGCQCCANYNDLRLLTVAPSSDH
jgi:hypothetical protein